MRSVYVIPVILLLLIPAIVLIPGTDAAEGGLSLYEVNPYGEDEGISIHNYSNARINLSGYSITDNPTGSSEGRITFSQDLYIAPGETVTVCKTAVSGSAFQGRHTTYCNGSDGVTVTSNFALNNSGDDVYLFRGQTIIDGFCYGNITISDRTIWTGNPFKMTNNWFAIRIAQGNDASCWHSTKAGLTDNFFDPELKMDAIVTPFVFPDDRGVPIYKALEDAHDTVYIAIYILSSPNLIALLCELEKRGVDVTVMLERYPLGDYKPIQDSSMLKTLADAGGEILFIGDNGDRFSYHHAKYCVIDGEKVIITSENWTKANMNDDNLSGTKAAKGNRGWGAIVESKDYAGFMTDVFKNDSNMSYGDVFAFEEIVVNAKAKRLTYTSPSGEYSSTSYPAKITPMLSPDSSWDGTLYYMDNAKERIYSQQQDVASNFLNRDYESPLSAMAKKAWSGLDTRLIIGNPSSASDIDTINATFGVKAAEMSDPYVHNKGVICDDTVIVTSVNWTDNSFKNNRETMVAIHSKEVSDYYADVFLLDFERNYKYSGLNVWFEEIKDAYSSDETITVTVGVEQSGSFTYTWILDSETKVTDSPRTVLTASEGGHTLRVTVSDGSNNTGYAEAYFTVKGDSLLPDIDLGPLEKYKQYIVPIIVILIALIVAAIRISRGGR